MPFELKPRIKFHKNPLIEVACQLTYVSPILGVEDMTKLVAFHALVKDKLPLFKKAKSVSLNINTDSQAVDTIEAVMYEFSSIDEQVKVTIDAQNIACVTTNYESKEVFFGYIDDVYNALMDVGLITVPFKRVGLRYKNVIQRSLLGNEIKDANWSSLLADSLTSIFNDKDFSDNIVGTQSNIVISLNDIENNAKMNVNYGLVTHAQSKEECFIIDSDFYIEGVIAYAAANGFLSEANIKSRNFFQWCIKPKLYEALGAEQLTKC
jgi:uncharacterized protein (TIGR04255 family)